MDTSTREADISQTFVALADTLVTEYDVVDVLQNLIEQTSRILAAADAGILLPAASGDLSVIASTSERTQLVSLLQLKAEEGPCVEAYATGEPVSVDDIRETSSRWPVFASSAASVGFRSMYGIPMKFRGETIGSLNLFSERVGPMPEADVTIGRALTDVATVSLMQERALRESNTVREQLQRALDSRVLIEQAKGVLAQRENVGVDEAFALLRSQARNSGRRLSVVAQEIIAGTVER